MTLIINSNSGSAQPAKPQKNNELALGTKPNNANNNALGGNPNVTGETISLSDTSLKLSTASPVKSSATPIENSDQSQRALKQLISSFQSNPSLALAAHSNIFSGTVKSILG